MTLNNYHQSVELVERFAQCLLQDSKNENDRMLVKELAPYIAYFSNEIELNGKRDEIFEKYITMIDSATEQPDCEDVIQKFEQEIEKLKQKANRDGKNEKYVSFMKMISADAEGDNDDGEIQTISQTVSTIDPISKLPIVEPVKNKICGHTYDKTSILQLINHNRKVKCPIPGCNAIDYVKKTDLVPDLALKRMLTNTNVSTQKKLKLTE